MVIQDYKLSTELPRPWYWCVWQADADTAAAAAAAAAANTRAACGQGKQQAEPATRVQIIKADEHRAPALHCQQKEGAPGP